MYQLLFNIGLSVLFDNRVKHVKYLISLNLMYNEGKSPKCGHVHVIFKL